MKFPLRYSLLLVLFCAAAQGGEWSGNIAGELRLFPSEPLHGEQHAGNLSLSLDPEFHHEWEERGQSLVFNPFLRLDQHDPERTHADVRELYWQKVAERWELRLGIRTVFWGVTESQHLVDIINQTDLVENLDGEDKLGQPMMDLALIGEWGTLELFILPFFRERTFPGARGRLRAPLSVDTDDPEYESSAEDHHLDWALRWSRSVGDWDIGLSHFSGTGREPQLKLRLGGSDFLKLVPYYDQIQQTGLDVQLTKGPWLWKLEAIHRSGQAESFAAVTAGFEYTFTGVFGTAADVGILAEYLYDSRGDDAPLPFENDVFLGVRVGFNDTQTTELLAGAIVDPQSGATFASLELSRRLGSNWRLNVEARAFLHFPETDPAYSLRNDDYLQAELAWYF
ncbi:MAG: hypothetical protein IT365_16850 [Candidatus Hydrogenedentes bacterium]|nr:hypothetical protein [Candidatus Hydrogenedentota bacterium]